MVIDPDVMDCGRHEEKRGHHRRSRACPLQIFRCRGRRASGPSRGDRTGLGFGAVSGVEYTLAFVVGAESLPTSVSRPECPFYRRDALEQHSISTPCPYTPKDSRECGVPAAHGEALLTGRLVVRTEGPGSVRHWVR